MHRICLCPASIAWIRKHLQKSARATFSRLISKGSISKVKKKVRKGRKHLTQGIHHVIINGVSRKVRVNAKGQWRFLKGSKKRKKR